MPDDPAIRAVPGGLAATVEDRPAKTESETEQIQAKRRKLLELAHKRFQTSKNGESKLRANQKDDQLFAAGSLDSVTSTQWTQAAQQARATEQRPCITINRQPAFVRQITGQARQMPQSLIVSPYDNDADQDTAEVLQGLIRQIENTSDADVAYQTARDHQVRSGRGWVRVGAKYVSDESFDQDLFVGRIPNTFAVYPDPAHKEFDASDMRFCFVVEDMGKDEYLAQYGAIVDEAPDGNAFQSLGFEDYALDWAPEGKVKVAEYWWVDYTQDIALLLADATVGKGGVVLASQCQGLRQGSFFDENQRPAQGFIATVEGRELPVLRKRNISRRQVKVATIDGIHILEGNEDRTDGAEWRGNRIPLVPVNGEECNIDGQRDLRGIVRDAKEPGRAYNFFVTALTQQIGDAPKAPWILDMRSIAAYKKIWDTANSGNHAYLPYNSQNTECPDKPLPEPKRVFGEPQAIGAITAAIGQFDNDLKATIGIWDASLGERGPEQSGKAIFARQQQGGIGTAHFPGNEQIARRAVGRILIDLIPFYYDAGRIVRILGLDDQPRKVLVYAGQQNAPKPDEALKQLGVQPESAAAKVKHVFDLGVGRYDVTVSTAPSLATQRQEGANAMVQLAQAVPAIGEAAPDLLVEGMDFPGHQKLAKRLSKVIRPDLRDEDPNGPAALPPQVQAQMAQAQQVIDALTQQLNAAVDERDAKAQELQSRENVARTQADVQLAIAAMKTQSAEALALFQAEVQRIHTFLEMQQAERQAQQQAAEAAQAPATAPTGGAA